MLFLLSSLSAFHVSSFSVFSANINEKVEGVNQQKKKDFSLLKSCVQGHSCLCSKSHRTWKMSLVSSYAICQWCLWTHSTTLRQRWQPYAVVIHQASFFPQVEWLRVVDTRLVSWMGGKKIAKWELCSYFHSRTLNYGFRYTRHQNKWWR